MRNDTDIHLIQRICDEEQLAYLENQLLYKPRIEATARTLREIYGLGETKTVSLKKLEKIANAFKFRVHPTDDLPDEKRGMLIRIVAGDRKSAKQGIFIRKSLKLNQARFVLCHEIGHHILEHTPITINEALERKNFNFYRTYLRNELEANYFAGALLIDEKLFRRDIESCENSLEELAVEYGVTYETVVHRYFEVANETRMHFMKVNQSREIIKRYSRSNKYIPWLKIKNICAYSSAAKALLLEVGGVVNQESILVGFNEKENHECEIGNMQCCSKLVEKTDSNEKSKHSITVGYRKGVALVSDAPERVWVSVLNCGYDDKNYCKVHDYIARHNSNEPK